MPDECECDVLAPEAGPLGCDVCRRARGGQRRLQLEQQRRQEQRDAHKDKEAEAEHAEQAELAEGLNGAKDHVRYCTRRAVHDPTSPLAADVGIKISRNNI